MSSRNPNSTYDRKVRSLTKSTSELSKSLRKFDAMMHSSVSTRAKDIKELASNLKEFGRLSNKFNKRSMIETSTKASEPVQIIRSAKAIGKSVTKLGKIIDKLHNTLGRAPQSLKKELKDLKKVDKVAKAVASMTKKLGKVPSLTQLRQFKTAKGTEFRAQDITGKKRVIKQKDVQNLLAQYGISAKSIPSLIGGTSISGKRFTPISDLVSSQSSLYETPLRQELGLDTPILRARHVMGRRLQRAPILRGFERRAQRKERIGKVKSGIMEEFRSDDPSKSDINKIYKERRKIEKKLNRELRRDARRKRRIEKIEMNTKKRFQFFRKRETADGEVLPSKGKKLMTGVGKVFKGVGKAMKGLKAFIGILKAIKALQPIFDIFSGVISILTGILSATLIPLIQFLVQSLFSPETMEIFRAIGEQFGLLVNMVVELLESLDVGDLLKSFLDIFTELISLLTSDAVKTILKSILQLVIDIMPELFKIVIALLPVVVALLDALAPGIPIISAIVLFIVMLVTQLVEKLSPALLYIGEIVGFIATGILTALGWLANQVIKALNFFGADMKLLDLSSATTQFTTSGKTVANKSVDFANQMPILSSQGLITRTGVAQVHAGEIVATKETIGAAAAAVYNDTFYIDNRFYGSYEKQKRDFKESVDEMYRRRGARY